MKQLKVGIIGQGRSGYGIHVTSLAHMSDRFKVVAVSDPFGDRMKDAVEQGAEAHADYHELIARDDLDLIVNSTPSSLHVPVTREAFEAGRNVLCEKPLARRAAEVDELIELAKDRGVFFAVFQQSRFAPYFEQVRKVIDSGVLGRIVMIKAAANGFSRRWDWQTLQEYHGGNLLNTGPHSMDQILQLFGPDKMPNVNCFLDRANTFGDADDFAKVILSGEGSPLIDLEISSCDAYPLYSYHVHGDRGGLTGTATQMKWKYYVESEAPEQSLTRDPIEGRQYCREELPMHEETWEWKKDPSSKIEIRAEKFYHNLYDAMTSGAELIVKPEQVRIQIAVMEECHRQNPLSRIDG